MTDVVEPGTRLVQRYRLEEHLDGLERAPHRDEGTSYWRAKDELLDRPVGVCLLRAGDPNAAQVLKAARLAAAVSDPRFLRVLDASEVDGVVYVVTEWVRATNLVDLLEDGPLPPHEAHALAADVAGALAAAHAEGLSHRCLRPEQVLRTTHGQVKVAGLGVEAAAHGLLASGPEEAARRDTEGAAAVLYAALTARWPGEGATGLAEAPHDGAALCSPRQVRAGVPVDLDDVVCRALGVPGRHNGDRPLRTPAELLAALEASQPTNRMPVIDASPAQAEEEPPFGRPPAAPYDDTGPRRRRPTAGTLAWAAAALVLVVGLGLFGGQLAMTGLGGGDEPGEQPGAGANAEEKAPARQRPLAVQNATTLDPAPDGNGEENGDRAGLAVDDDPGTTWPTKTYDDPFGPAGLKNGVGLLLDLGDVRDVSRVAVTVQGGATDLEVRVAEDPGEALEDFALFDRASNLDGRTVLRAGDPVRGRYVLVWLTALPLRDDGYRGEVAEVTVGG